MPNYDQQQQWNSDFSQQTSTSDSSDNLSPHYDENRVPYDQIQDQFNHEKAKHSELKAAADKLNAYLQKISEVGTMANDIGEIRNRLEDFKDLKKSNRSLERALSNAIVELQNARRIFEIEDSSKKDDVWIGIYFSLLIINSILWVKSKRLFVFSLFSSILIISLKFLAPDEPASSILKRGLVGSLSLFVVWMIISFIKLKFAAPEEENVIY